MRFSPRLPEDLTPTALTTALGARRPTTDLTESNPTRCGFCYPVELTGVLAKVDFAKYAPEPLGLASARGAVAGYLGARGQTVDPQQVVLTASTSEAYGFLFKLFCAPGEAVAVPSPSYPLLDVLAELEAVAVRRYRLRWDGAWQLDRASLTAALAAGVRAVVVVEPNNPTGSFLACDDARFLEDACAAAGVPVICDEVFSPYRESGAPAGLATAAPAGLRIRLDGLSKAAGLPQLKLSWMVLEGEPTELAAARERLEWIADAYLSVATPVQLALPDILRAAPQLQQQIRARVGANRAALHAALAVAPASAALPAQGGWNAVLRLPRVLTDEQWVVALASEADVAVHPGYFYELEPGHVVVSLLLPEAAHRPAVARLAATLARHGG